MKCNRCGNEDLHVVSEYVELPEKKEYGVTNFLIFLIIISFLVAIIFLFVGISNCVDNDGAPFNFIVGLVFIGLGISFSVTYCIIKIFQPYEHTTKLRVVCLKCGESWIIPTEPKKTEE